MADFGIKLQGLDELIERTTDSPKVRDRELKVAMKNSIKAGKAAVVQRAPRHHGARSVASQSFGPIARKISARQRGRGTEMIGTIKAPWYGRFVEGGTRAHDIGGKGKLLSFEAEGNRVTVRRARHPGVTARPFMEPAFHATEPVVLREFDEAVERIVVELAR